MIAISTAYKKALIGLEINGKRAVTELDANCSHSENLLFSLNKILEENDLSIKQNDVFGVVIGPGSFTGIRISVALIKGFCAPEKKKIVPITTFDLMAHTYLKTNPKEDFCCVINALSGLYFVCKYSFDGKKLEEEKVVSAEALGAINCSLVGLEEENVCPIKVQPTAEDLLEIASLKKNEQIDANQIAPLYLRRSQAEDSLEEKLKNTKKS